ncbi:MAG: amidohydrolase [Actinobacteria bacterium]|nr:amidohydrolase [Actinomycetota bacterium]
MTSTLDAQAPSEGRRELLTVDCDVHPHVPGGLSGLIRYMSHDWRQRLGAGHEQGWAKDVYASQFSIPRNVLYVNPVGVMRRDAVPEDGSVPCSDPRVVAAQLLDPFGIDRAILIGGNVLGLGGLPDADLAAVIASAYNDWMSEHWLQVDERFRGALVVAPQDAGLAVAEIERVADRPGIAQVHLPLMNVLMGERHFHPIYAAAAERGLPISIHPNSADGIFAKAPALAGGVFTYYLEWHTALTQIAQSNVISLVCQGVFERFPGLKIVIAEGGFAWLPDVMWRLDKDWHSVRAEVPWLKRLPSEYILEHVRFTTQPFIEDVAPEHVQAICEIVRAEQTLLFSSDYPHWDFDNPKLALNLLPPATRERVFGGTAAELYGSRL